MKCANCGKEIGLPDFDEDSEDLLEQLLAVSDGPVAGWCDQQCLEAFNARIQLQQETQTIH